MMETITRTKADLSGAKPGTGLGDGPAGAGGEADIGAVLQVRERMLRNMAVVGEQILGFAAGRLRQDGVLRHAVRDGGPETDGTYAPALVRRSLEDAERLAELAGRIMMLSGVMQAAACAQAAGATRLPIGPGPVEAPGTDAPELSDTAGGGAGRVGGPESRLPDGGPISLARADALDLIRRRVLRRRRGVAPGRTQKPTGRAEVGPP